MSGPTVGEGRCLWSKKPTLITKVVGSMMSIDKSNNLPRQTYAPGWAGLKVCLFNMDGASAPGAYYTPSPPSLRGGLDKRKARVLSLPPTPSIPRGGNNTSCCQTGAGWCTTWCRVVQAPPRFPPGSAPPGALGAPGGALHQITTLLSIYYHIPM